MNKIAGKRSATIVVLLSTILTGASTFFPVAAGAMKTGEKAPPLILRNTRGRYVDLAELLKSKKAVVINFFQEGCVECVRGLPFLVETYRRYREKGLRYSWWSRERKRDTRVKSKKNKHPLYPAFR